MHPEPHARVTRKDPPLTTQNPPLLGFNFFLNFLLAQRSFSFLYFRSWRCFLQTAYIWIQASLPGPAAAEPRKPGGSHEQAGAARESQEATRAQTSRSGPRPCVQASLSGPAAAAVRKHSREEATSRQRATRSSAGSKQPEAARRQPGGSQGAAGGRPKQPGSSQEAAGRQPRGAIPEHRAYTLGY